MGVTRDTSSRLPPHHIERPRLTGLCAERTVVVVEAAGGYGKSVFAAELVESWGALPVWVLLEEGTVSARLLAARLRDAVVRAGLTDAAGSMAARGDDPSGAVDAMLAALQTETCAIVVDDAHHADRDAAQLLARIAAQRGPSTRLVVLARRIPDGAERLRRAEAFALSAADLALRPEESRALCRTGFGLEVSTEEVRRLDDTTGGWTAAAVLAASRAKHTDQRLGDVISAGATRADPVQSILEEALSAPGSDRARFAEIAALPLLDRELLERVTGEPAFFDQALAWGLPISPAQDGWWEMPGPVREALARLGSVASATLRVAAAYYQGRGRLGTALQMLLAADEFEAAARLLDETEPWVIDTVDVLELLSVIERIPDAVLHTYPRAMLTVARCCGAAWMMDQQSLLLERLDTIVDHRERPELRRAVDVELAAVAFDRGDLDGAEATARRLLEVAGPTERLTRARALSLCAHLLARRRRADGRVDAAALREADACYGRAQELQLALGNRAAAASLALGWAVNARFEAGRPQAGLETLGAGLAFAADHPRRFVRLLVQRVSMLAELGRYDEAEAGLDEAERLAGQLGDRWMQVYAAWFRMTCASMRGDATAVLRGAAGVEGTPGVWWEWEGALFLAEAADCLDRVGKTALAWEYLERARRDPQTAGPAIAMAECALLARHGDPAEAEERLAVVETQGIPLREYWRVTLLRAYAGWRRGDPTGAGLAARAFEEAARLGQPQLPLIRERELTEALLGLAAATGQPAAVALQTASLPTALTVLGQFELTNGGRPVALPPGQGPRLLKLLAVSGGRLPAEEAIEALWPEGEPSAGRNRLRTLLNRVREAAGEVVIRDGELLALGPDVHLDLTRFRDEARQAEALRAGDPAAAVAVARAAIARYRGPLLLHDPYEEWAAEPREQASRTMLDLLDLCADVATDRGDLDETRRMVERTIELAPYDDDRYLRVALILHRQGRRGAALSVLRRARAALAQLGIDPPRALVELERTVAAPDTIRAGDGRPRPVTRAGT